MASRFLFIVVFLNCVLWFQQAQAAVTAMNTIDKPFWLTDRILSDLPVDQRVQPGFAMPISRLGAFFLQPSLELNERFNTNIYAVPYNRKQDFITSIKPRLQVGTLNQNYGFRASISGDVQRYAHYISENTNDYTTTVEPYWQITHAQTLEAQWSYEQDHEDRTDPDASLNNSAAEPVTYHRGFAHLGWAYKPARLGVTVFSEETLYDFDNVARFNGGVPIVNTDRNRVENTTGIKANYDITDRSNTYVQLHFLNRNYQHHDYDVATTSFSGTDRDSQGIEAMAGLKLPLTHLLDLESEVGHRWQNFDDVTFDDITTRIGKVRLRWLPTALMTFYLTGERKVFETIQPFAAALVQSRLSTNIYHELRRNIVLDGGVATGVDDYIGFDRQDHFTGAGIGVTYKVNRFLDWRLAYAWDKRQSNLDFADYTRQQIFVTAKVMF